MFQRFFDEVERLSLSREVLVTGSTCTGPCEHGPVVVVHPGTAFYGNVKEPDVARILESHARGEQVTELLLPESAWDEP
ncbi:MAG: (2Fe-2S) ferredoxin domain-containing protein [Acidobacteriota bacterium]